MSNAFKNRFKTSSPHPYSHDSDNESGSKHGKYIDGSDGRNISDTVSELSVDDNSSLASGFSKSSGFRKKLGKFGRKKKNRGSDEGSVSTSAGRSVLSKLSRGSKESKGSKAHTPTTRDTSASTTSGAANRATRTTQQSQSPAAPPSVGSKSNHSRDSKAHSGQTSEQRLIKDAKSRYNIGLVYLKTKDYAKAQENLEHSLYCHIQLAGHDSKVYTNESLFAIASVREKLGDCYFGNVAVLDKYLALDHYEEARRLLRSVDPEDAPDNVIELLARVEEKLNQPELQQKEPRKSPPRGAGEGQPLPPKKYERAYKTKNTNYGRASAATGAAAAGVGVAAVGVGAATSAARATTNAAAASGAAIGSGGAATTNRAGDNSAGKSKDESRVKKKFHKIGGLAAGIFDTIEDAFDRVEDKVRGDDSDSLNSSDNIGGSSSSQRSANLVQNNFEMAMVHLERDNHRTALNHLSSIQVSGAMKDEAFRAQMVEYMMRVAVSAMNVGKIGVATDAYEEAFAIQKQEDEGGRSLDLAMKGCIKGHKLLALEEEKKGDYETAVQHRNRVFQLLEMDERVIPAARQLLNIAFLHGQMENYEQSTENLGNAIKGFYTGVDSLDHMPKDRLPSVIQCYQMRAICYAKMKQWNLALEQYEEVLPLVARESGISSKDYNKLLIHKAVLLVTMERHADAVRLIQRYVKFSQDHHGGIVIDESDHNLGLDTCAAAHLKLGNIDGAIDIFEKKLELAKSLPKNDEVKSETMHKLGCLLAYKKRHKEALPLLTGALDTRKFLYDGKNGKLFESSWAVAAVKHSLGDSSRALKDYSNLLDKVNKVEDSPVNAVVIHNSAGKLYFDEGNIDKAIKSFKEALKGVGSSENPNLKADIMLNLANALTSKGDHANAIKMYDGLMKMPSVKQTKFFYLSLYNKSLMLIKKGDSTGAKPILEELTKSRSLVARDVKGSAYWSLGNISCNEGNIDEALEYYQKSLKIFTGVHWDLNSVTQVNKSIALAYLELEQYDTSVSKLEDVLEDLNNSETHGKVVNLLKADAWCLMGRVYHRKGDISVAKNFCKLALQSHKQTLGETHPITLRNVSNLAVLLLEEAEGLPKSQSKTIIDAAKFEMEDTLDKFLALDDLWAYRLDVTSLKTNLAFIAVWQEKPKKAKKLLKQLQEIEIPENHPLNERIALLEERLKELEKANS